MRNLHHPGSNSNQSTAASRRRAGPQKPPLSPFLPLDFAPTAEGKGIVGSVHDSADINSVEFHPQQEGLRSVALGDITVRLSGLTRRKATPFFPDSFRNGSGLRNLESRLPMALAYPASRRVISGATGVAWPCAAFSAPRFHQEAKRSPNSRWWDSSLLCSSVCCSCITGLSRRG